MEDDQVDQSDVRVSPHDPEDSMVQEVKGQKVLATPAVRRLARENNVNILCFFVSIKCVSILSDTTLNLWHKTRLF